MQKASSKTVSGLILILLLIGMFNLSFHIQPVSTSDTVGIPEKCSEAIEVLKHKMTASELNELKQTIGVCEEGGDYNQIIDGHGTGLRPPTEEGWSKILIEAYVVEDILCDQRIESVISVDHSTGPWFPPIGNQDGEGSCVAWAVGYYMKTFQEAKEHGWNLTGAEWEGGYTGHPTEAYQNRIFSPDFIYHQINDGEDEGSCFSDAMNLVCSIGACSWEKMPYDPYDHMSWPSEDAWREAPLYRGNNTGLEFMNLSTDSDLNDFKNWISSGHLAAIAVNASQYSQLTSKDVWTLDNYVPEGVNHANTIVGFNDSLEYTEKGETRYGAFKIANSWGVGGWENVDDGCYWLSYEATKQCVGHCMFYRDIMDYKPKLVASFMLDHSKRGECEITVGIGNKSAPIQTKRFDDWICGNGGNHSFCSNSIVFDITEFEDVVTSIIGQPFFIKIYDGGSYTEGTIQTFSIEYYSNYTGRLLYISVSSGDPPVNTENKSDVYASLILEYSPDISISNVTISKDLVGRGEYVSINVTVENQGNNTETFNVTTYANQTVIEVYSNVTLPGRNFTTLISTWNTTGFPPGNYTISAYATPVENETDIADNTYVDGSVLVTFNRLWMEPSTIELDSTRIPTSYRFNVTVWGNSSLEFKGWQFWLLYHKDYINATGCWYCLSDESASASGPSEFMADAGATVPVTPDFDSHNATHSRVEFGEVWMMGIYSSPKAGRCAILEFEVFGLPAGGETVEVPLDIKWGYESSDPRRTYLLYYDGSKEPLNAYNSLVKIREFTHDLAITDIGLSKTVVFQGCTVEGNVTIQNQGEVLETFNLTLYANETIIAEIENINLVAGNFTKIIFTWNATGFEIGNYTISAYAWPVQGEKNTDDNTYMDGMVEVISIPWDVTGDGYVGIDDIVAVAEHFGENSDDPDWDPKYDINNDYYVGIDDIVETAEHFGEGG